MTQVKDLAGKTFSRLSVIERVENNKHGKAVWSCICSCGNWITAAGCDLTTGNTTSCGCVKAERIRELNKKHGQSKTRLHMLGWP